MASAFVALGLGLYAVMLRPRDVQMQLLGHVTRITTTGSLQLVVDESRRY